MTKALLATFFSLFLCKTILLIGMQKFSNLHKLHIQGKPSRVFTDIFHGNGIFTFRFHWSINGTTYLCNFMFDFDFDFKFWFWLDLIWFEDWEDFCFKTQTLSTYFYWLLNTFLISSKSSQIYHHFASYISRILELVFPI